MKISNKIIKKKIILAIFLISNNLLIAQENKLETVEVIGIIKNEHFAGPPTIINGLNSIYEYGIKFKVNEQFKSIHIEIVKIDAENDCEDYSKKEIPDSTLFEKEFEGIFNRGQEHKIGFNIAKEDKKKVGCYKVKLEVTGNKFKTFYLFNGAFFK